jgi:hypothetical protein
MAALKSALIMLVLALVAACASTNTRAPASKPAPLNEGVYEGHLGWFGGLGIGHPCSIQIASKKIDNNYLMIQKTVVIKLAGLPHDLTVPDEVFLVQPGSHDPEGNTWVPESEWDAPSPAWMLTMNSTNGFPNSFVVDIVTGAVRGHGVCRGLTRKTVTDN